MQADDGWRRTLIELAKEHRESALLRFVLKQLSDRGHHREIAAVINETDLFSVFNGEKAALCSRKADGGSLTVSPTRAALCKVVGGALRTRVSPWQLFIGPPRALVKHTRCRSVRVQLSLAAWAVRVIPCSSRA